eukprot:gene12761-8700_t
MFKLSFELLSPTSIMNPLLPVSRNNNNNNNNNSKKTATVRSNTFMLRLHTTL